MILCDWIGKDISTNRALVVFINLTFYNQIVKTAANLPPSDINWRWSELIEGIADAFWFRITIYCTLII